MAAVPQAAFATRKIRLNEEKRKQFDCKYNFYLTLLYQIKSDIEEVHYIWNSVIFTKQAVFITVVGNANMSKK